MAEIAVTDARALFTKGLMAVYQERIRPTGFLRSFFPSVTEPTKLISIEVERMGEKVAVDVARGTEGSRVEFTKSSEKVFLPPLYRLYMDATELDLYDRVLGSQASDNTDLFVALMNRVADRVGNMQDMIERAYELQCSQVIHNGIVTVRFGTNIDFKRKAASIVDLAANPWSNNATDPFAQLKSGGDFLRKVGRSSGEVINAICADDALAALLANTKFTARQNYFNMALDRVLPPQRNSVGATYNGTLTAGPYKIQLWAYPQFYDLKSGPDSAPVYTTTPYLTPGEVVLLPEKPNFRFGFAAVPQLVGQPGQLPVQGEYVMGQFLDTRNAKHDFDIQSAGVAVPVAVDQIYTMKNLV